MESRFRRNLALAVSWMVFPLLPVVLEDYYYQTFNLSGADPHDWDWLAWVIMLGPLVGYSFLAGTTLDNPDDGEPSRRRLSHLLGRRAVWVAIGPWCGLVFWGIVYFGLMYLNELIDKLIPSTLRPILFPPQWWPEIRSHWAWEWAGTVVWWGLWATLAYGWLWPAWAALRRAARIGSWGRALYCGLVAALAFVGSLFGTFWAIISMWRSYFFDPRVMPLVALALGLVFLSGCAATTLTYGEVRRRDLFHAMLVAWVLGLAFMWRWWSRRRPGSH